VRLCYELGYTAPAGAGAQSDSRILAEEEGLTLTEISHRLQRTPGSTKDYLSWLEDVDLVTSRQTVQLYGSAAAGLVRLHCHASALTEDDLVREVHRYALPRCRNGSPRQGDRRRRSLGRRSQGVGHHRNRLTTIYDLAMCDLTFKDKS
jgi:hypothetical protein